MYGAKMNRRVLIKTGIALSSMSFLPLTVHSCLQGQLAYRWISAKNTVYDSDKQFLDMTYGRDSWKMDKSGRFRLDTPKNTERGRHHVTPLVFYDTGSEKMEFSSFEIYQISLVYKVGNFGTNTLLDGKAYSTVLKIRNLADLRLWFRLNYRRAFPSSWLLGVIHFNSESNKKIVVVKSEELNYYFCTGGGVIVESYYLP